jgi:hypothetical protein
MELIRLKVSLFRHCFTTDNGAGLLAALSSKHSQQSMDEIKCDLGSFKA